MDKRTKWSYCVGAVGRDAAYTLVNMFLMLYVQYTMNLTTAQFAAISACMVVCFIWDAVNDLLMGIIIENAHMKMGKFRPWILLGCILNAIVIICLFSIRPSGWAFVAFYGIGYLCWGMTFTMNDISYWGMLPSLSSDSAIRDSLVTTMSVFCSVGQFAVAGIVPMVIAGNAVKAYRTIAFVVALSFIAFQLLTTFGVKERPRQDNKEKLSLKGMFNIFVRNDQLVAAGIACLLFNIGNGLLIIFGVNFFYVEFGYSDSGTLVFLFTVMYGVGMLLAQLLYQTFTKKLVREQLLKLAITCIVIGYVLLMSYGYVLPKNTVLLNAIGLMLFFFQGLMNLAIIVMVNNTIEYDEVKFHERHDSVISAVRSFSVKLAGGVNQGLSALVLIISGIYAVSQKISGLEIEVDKGAISSEAAVTEANNLLAGIATYQTVILRLGMVIIPIITMGTAVLILKKKYVIDEKEYERLCGILENER